MIKSVNHKNPLQSEVYGCYYLDGKKVVKAETMDEFINGQMEDNTICKSELKAPNHSTSVLVSTVFIGMDLSVTGEPLVFESMIIGGVYDQTKMKSPTWNKAVEQHNVFVALLVKEEGLSHINYYHKSLKEKENA